MKLTQTVLTAGTVLALTAPVAAAQAAPSAPSAPAAQSAALATVNMEAVVKAAQIDPRRPDHTYTAGAKDSVLRVEQALAAKKLLDAKWVDGYFGSQTITAYTKYQRSLGYTGLDANGLPGKSSLVKLGSGRFTVTNQIAPGARTTWGGKTFNTRTAAMLSEAQRLSGVKLSVTQGSYNAGGVSASAGTHDGGGAGDLSVKGLTATQRTNIVTAMRRVGFAAWYRTPSQGPWAAHIHFEAISDTDLSVGAQHQVGDYCLGLNGLAGKGKDDGPRIPIKTWEEYQRSR